MIHTTDNFYNKAAQVIDNKYFPNVKYYADNPNTLKVHQTLELFNNGCLTYRKLIGRISTACKASGYEVHQLIEPLIMSFGSYTYRPRKP